MDELPLVTVVLPTYNRPNYLRKAVESVSQQSYSNIELIVVDDCSETFANEVLSDYDIDLKIIRHDNNKGASAARNTGLKHAQGEFIAFLDDDDEWDSSKIEKQVSVFLSSSEKVGMVYTGRKFAEENKIVQESIPDQEGRVWKEILMDNFVGSYSVAMIRSEVVSDVGLLDERFPTEQDWEWYIRIAQDWEFKAVPEALVTRNHSHGQISSDYQSSRETSYPLVIKKYSPEVKNEGYLFLRKWKSKLYFDLGWGALVRTEEYKLSRAYFCESIKQYPLFWSSYLFIIASLFHPIFDYVPPEVKKTLGRLVRY